MPLDEELDEIEDLEMLDEDLGSGDYYQGTNYLKKWIGQFIKWVKRKVSSK